MHQREAVAQQVKDRFGAFEQQSAGGKQGQSNRHRRAFPFLRGNGEGAAMLGDHMPRYGEAQSAAA